jgi:hypothetical protein
MTTPASVLVRANLINKGFTCLAQSVGSAGLSVDEVKMVWKQFQPVWSSWLAFHETLKEYQLSTDPLGTETEAWAAKYVEMKKFFKQAGIDVSKCPTLLQPAEDIFGKIKEVAIWVAIPVGLFVGYQIYKDLR